MEAVGAADAAGEADDASDWPGLNRTVDCGGVGVGGDGVSTGGWDLSSSPGLRCGIEAVGEAGGGVISGVGETGDGVGEGISEGSGELAAGVGATLTSEEGFVL